MRLPAILLAALSFISIAAIHAQSSLGIFTSHQDIGNVRKPGNTVYDPLAKTYTVTGSGENMWFKRDDFQFAWTKASGDVALSADIAFQGAGANPHRKAVLMIRQSLAPGTTSIDLARHGEGLTALQFRASPGVDTHEIQSNISAPQHLRIEKRGDFVYAFVSGKDGVLRPAGTAMRMQLTGSFYVGIGVCSHDANTPETAIFSNVALTSLAPSTVKPVLYSVLETINLSLSDRRVVYAAPAHFEAPNWSHDGSYMLFNQDGHIFRLPVKGDEADAAKPQLIDSGAQMQCNNDHGISPDGRSIVISDSSASGGSSVYIFPAQGGTPRRITKLSPSYWHGWSPDGKTLAFVGDRHGEFDIYTIPATGGDETRITTAKGLDDGPEYTPDGQYIYFNSERTGHMQIWRMKPDGSEQEQVLTTDENDWFPHFSPDGKWMVFLAYDNSVTGHPGEKNVELKLMSTSDKQVRTLTKLFGGQGTINVPSWSPDSKQLAFVSYELIPPQDLLAK